MNLKPETRPETKHGKKAQKCTESKLGFKIKKLGQKWTRNPVADLPESSFPLSWIISNCFANGRSLHPQHPDEVFTFF